MLKKKKKNEKKSTSVRFTDQERKMLERMRELFGTENMAQTIRKVVRDTATELGVR